MKRLMLVLAAVAMVASSAWAGKIMAEFCPGMEGYVSSPEITWCAGRNESGTLELVIEGGGEKDYVLFTVFPEEEGVRILCLGELGTIGALGSARGSIGYLYAGSGVFNVKMKNFDIGLLECAGLKKAKVNSLEGLVQKYSGYVKGAVIKAMDHLGVEDEEPGRLGRFGGCIKKLCAARVLNIFGYAVISGEVFQCAPVSSPKRLVVKSGQPMADSHVYLLASVESKEKNVEVEPRTPEEEKLYLRVDLETGEVVEDLAAPSPWGEEDMTRFLWLRRISAGTCVLGSPDEELGRFDWETEYQVRLTRDFWAGVFPLTEGQYARISGEGDPAGTLPQVRLSYDAMRGTVKGARFPGGTQVDEESVIWRLRELCGGEYLFDLPTDAQWEFACKAGTHASWNDGTAILAEEDQDPNLDRLGWYMWNSDGELHPVGQKIPNAWGLYDMHGNVCEWCLDWHMSDPSDMTEDPVGPAKGQKRVLRGGNINCEPGMCRSATRLYFTPDFASDSIGVRIFMNR